MFFFMERQVSVKRQPRMTDVTAFVWRLEKHREEEKDRLEKKNVIFTNQKINLL